MKLSLTQTKRMLRRTLRGYGMYMPWHRGKGRLLGQLGPKLVEDGEEEIICLPCGLKMSLNLRELVQQNIYYWGYYEPNLVNFVKHNLGKGDLFLDIGAHTGQYTLIAAQLVGVFGEVHAFEPSKNNFNRLTKNVDLNGFRNCYLNNLALGDFSGESSLYQKISEKYNQGALKIIKSKGDIFIEKISILKLDDYDKIKNKKINVIKMDVEGAELLVLIGGKNVIDNSRPLMILEAEDDLLHKFGHSRHQLISYLQQFDYSFYIIDNVRPSGLKGINGIGTIICIPNK